jgi:hypothetical protein
VLQGTTAKVCPIGTYRKTPGASTLAQCVPCPAGYYCELATVDPVPC